MTRSAVDTIKGYFYQFDYSIKQIMELDTLDDHITVEHIEDVDIKSASETTAIQCKYYEKSEYNHSVIAQPIRYMLTHYMNIKNNATESYRYKLYGFYSKGQEKLALPITVDFLKSKFLTYTSNKVKHEHHIEKGATNDDLTNFIELLTIDINAQEYNEQVQSIIEIFTKQFNCNHFDAEHYFYNNALKVIKDISTKSDVTERLITKGDFLELINRKKLLFNHWFIEYKGLANYYRAIRKEYFTTLNTSPFDRFFLIDIDNNNYKRSELKELILILSNKWGKTTRRTPSPFCPYIYINNIAEVELIELKKEFERESFGFVDGYNFQGAEFNVKSILKQPFEFTNIKIKFVNHINELYLLLDKSNNTKEIYQFYYNEPFFSNTQSNVKEVQIQLTELIGIKEVI